MPLPETPQTIENLDLLKQLEAYGDGKAAWLPEGAAAGDRAKEACRKLRSGLVDLANTVANLLNKVNAKEMDTFTMHDRRHALKVAHLMWHILPGDRRARLTPPEIAILVSAAYLHDLGMFLSNDERERRLSADSDLWDRLEIDPEMRRKFEDLQRSLSEEKVPARQQRLARQLVQAEEALLCLDTRDRHSTADRFRQILDELSEFHMLDPTRMPDVDGSLAFEGDSFREKLVDVCASHNDDPELLVAQDPEHRDRPRFPRDYPVGSATVDLHMVAAALRLADILDFDRERTPPVLYHYFLPGPLDPAEDRSALQWGKHLAISNWQIDTDAIVFRGRCTSHVVHHAIVQFCDLIAEEIRATRATFSGQADGAWPIALPDIVKADIHEDGYHYVPYKFELDDERIYTLLMGGAIYDNPLVAIRELVQNAVDACKLRDALTRLYEPELTPGNKERIFIEYREPDEKSPYPLLTVRDTGTGMDEFVLNRWFLHVGRSYYNSAEFHAYRVQLRKANLDFAPVSEFGIGFLSCFLLADKVEVQTAMWSPLRKDARKRVLEIHGPTRLIRLNEYENAGAARFRGTRVTLTLTRGGTKNKAPTWHEVDAYLREICRDLPYRLHVKHVARGDTSASFIDPQPLEVELPEHLEPHAIRIKVNDEQSGLEGEIALIHPGKGARGEAELAEHLAARVEDQTRDSIDRVNDPSGSALLRGGFSIGGVPGLPVSYDVRYGAKANLRMMWQQRQNRRFAPTNLSRSEATDANEVAANVIRIWMTWLLEHVDELEPGLFLYSEFLGYYSPAAPFSSWIERFDAYQVYRLAANGWRSWLHRTKDTQDRLGAWENCEGRPLCLGRYRLELFHNLLDLVLPHVCNLSVDAEAGFYVATPSRGWQGVLRECRDYVSHPVTWGDFVEYTGAIENLLFYKTGSTRQLNLRYRERVETAFAADEVRHLIHGLGSLADSRSGSARQIAVSSQVLVLLKRAREALGDLEIGSINGIWRMDSFKLPDAYDA